MSPLEIVLSLLSGAKKSGNTYLALCPAHDDHHPSLAIRETEDCSILVHCWAGCPTEAVVTAIGLEMRDLFPAQPTGPRRRSKAERVETAKRQAEIALERRFRQVVELVSLELAGMICAVNQTLARGGWEMIMTDSPDADSLATLAHRVIFWEYLADELLRTEVEAQLAALPAARREVARWETLAQNCCNS